jgi:type I restriction enzyme S subunit
MKPYPVYKDSGIEWIGEVPKDWEIKRLKYLDRTIMGQSPDSENYNKDGIGIPFLQGNADFSSMNPVPNIWCKNSNKLAEKEDILLSVRAPVGAVNIADQIYGIGRGLCAIRSKQSHKKYLYYRTLCLVNELDRIATGSTYTAISVDQVNNVVVPEPKFNEQTAIAAYLDRKTAQIDDLIAKKERMIELLQEERTAIINQAVTKGLDPNVEMKDTGIEWIGKIPKHWDIKKLKFNVTVRFSNVNKKTEEGELPIRLCNYIDVYYNEVIIPELDFMEASATVEEMRKFQLRIGDVLVTKDSEEWNDIAVPAYVGSELTNVLCGYHLAKISPAPDLINGKFLFWLLSSNCINYQFQIEASGVTRFSLSNYALNNSIILIPPVKEQGTIASFLDQKTLRIDGQIVREKKMIDYLQEYRTSLISEVVTGKVDITEYIS